VPLLFKNWNLSRLHVRCETDRQWHHVHNYVY